MARILIVDDDVTVGRSMASYLEDYDHQVWLCEDAETALTLTQGHAIELAIVDLRLPGINGEALICRLYDERSVIHFLIHTGAVHYSLSNSLIALGISPAQVLYKPLEDLEVLRTAIDRELTPK